MRRRDVLTGLGALGLLSAGSAAPGGLDVPALDVASEVRWRAIALARGAFVPPHIERLPPPMAAMGYDEYRDLRFRPDKAVWHGLGLGFELRFFPAAYIYRSPVEIYLVEQGSILQVAAARGLFDFGLQGVPLNAPLSLSGFLYDDSRARAWPRQRSNLRFVGARSRNQHPVRPWRRQPL